jgi:muconolactone delta-isomerase
MFHAKGMTPWEGA